MEKKNRINVSDPMVRQVQNLYSTLGGNEIPKKSSVLAWYSLAHTMYSRRHQISAFLKHFRPAPFENNPEKREKYREIFLNPLIDSFGRFENACLMKVISSNFSYDDSRGFDTFLNHPSIKENLSITLAESADTSPEKRFKLGLLFLSLPYSGFPEKLKKQYPTTETSLTFDPVAVLGHLPVPLFPDIAKKVTEHVKNGDYILLTDSPGNPPLFLAFAETTNEITHPALVALETVRSKKGHVLLSGLVYLPTNRKQLLEMIKRNQDGYYENTKGYLALVRSIAPESTQSIPEYIFDIKTKLRKPDYQQLTFHL